MKSLKFRVELDLKFRRAGYNDTPPENLEPDLNEAEVDIFMNEPFMTEFNIETLKPEGPKIARYYWYARSVAGFLSINVSLETNF